MSISCLQLIMLAKLAPRFVIRGVIQNAYYANYMAVQLCKQVIGQSHSAFYLQDPKHYFECNFYGHLSKLDKPTEFVDQFQALKYDEAIQKFAVYNQVKQLFEALNEFTLQLRELYRVIQVNNTSSNFFSRSPQSDQVWQEDVYDAISRYHNFLGKLQAYPQWKDKVVEEVGKWFLMIHNNLAQGESKPEIFSKLNRQQYFV